MSRDTWQKAMKDSMRRNDIPEQSRLQRFLSLDWDAIAGIVAAFVALMMHFLHLIETDVLLMIAVVLLALLFIRDLRRERLNERMAHSLMHAETMLTQMQASLRAPDAILVGPQQLRAESERFARRAQGEMVWFHVCLLMFRPQTLFDTLLRPAIENPLVTLIQFILDENQRQLWEEDVRPKLDACPGHAKVREPVWTTITENVSLILADTAPSGAKECLLSFWGEPFMARATGRDIPRYIFHIQGHSELVARFVELQRGYRLSS